MSDDTANSKKKEDAKKFLLEASNTGNISLLYSSLRLHPKILHEIDKEKFIDTPLHTAARMGHSKFCAEMMNLMPSFGKKLNPDGFSPLHLALQRPDHHTALTLVDIDKELVRVKGRDGITPLMYCAQGVDNNDTVDIVYDNDKDRLARFVNIVGDNDTSATFVDNNDMLATFLRDCPKAIFDKNTSSDTALHFALKSGNCKAAAMILNWLRRSSNEKSILDWKDDEGNTPLHLAVKYRCEKPYLRKAVEILVQIGKLNKRNNKFETPLDIAHQVGDPKTIKLLKSKKAKTSTQLVRRRFSYADFLQSDMSCWEMAIKYYTSAVNDLDVEMRNVILVVAALIAAATYTAMLQPPGGFYQASADTNTIHLASSVQPKSSASSVVKPKPAVGKMVMDNAHYVRFMPINTVAFTLAIVVIIFVLPGKPYTAPLLLSLLAVSYSCLIAMSFVSGDSRAACIIFYFSWSLLALAVVVKFWYFLLRGIMWKEWWMPNFILQATNSCDMMSCEPKDKRRSLMSFLRKQHRLTVGSLN